MRNQGLIGKPRVGEMKVGDKRAGEMRGDKMSLYQYHNDHARVGEGGISIKWPITGKFTLFCTIQW